jgi:hypothetical protein
VGNQSHLAKVDHQLEASLAWPYDWKTGKESCEEMG